MRSRYAIMCARACTGESHFFLSIHGQSMSYGQSINGRDFNLSSYSFLTCDMLYMMHPYPYPNRCSLHHDVLATITEKYRAEANVGLCVGMCARVSVQPLPVYNL